MLTSKQSILLMSAGVLLGRASDVLSDFEVELVADVCTRYAADKADTVVTDHEWPVIEAAVGAMRPVVHARALACVAEVFA
ncbi:hypothetical protein [Phenylobacterium sp. 58.2.17]|uniref:hypothetical protein n=1 Tax=Phenylobacterium sp. 58.2.17 TaxID=2969306 RepID=UPI0022645D24|nr:hypothetical protein [Phenylobacterium sp. 58.2.17]MCX7586568.1 hypothetical protein [Phenylobacterium sp. 58.2.17]